MDDSISAPAEVCKSDTKIGVSAINCVASEEILKDLAEYE